MTDKRELYKELNAKVDAAKALASSALDEAIAFADEHGLSFYWDGPAYGMGGYYQGDEKQRDYKHRGWEPSSGSCS